MARTSINFPTNTKLNPTGQFNKLVKNGDAWYLENTTTKQSKPLTTKQTKEEAFRAIVEPLLA